MTTSTIGLARRAAGTFYVWMAALFVLIGFSGFAITYWLPTATGTFTGSPLLHLHGILFSAWTLFFLSQTYMAASGQMQHHRAWGVAGVSLSTAMVFVGMATGIASMVKDIAAGYGDAARAFAIVPLTSALVFAVLIAWAVVTVKQGEVHKRLMMLATVSILQAPLGRFFFMPLSGLPLGSRPGSVPAASAMTTIPPAIVVGLLIAIAAVYDWRTRGKPHPVYAIGGPIVVLIEVLRAPLSVTPQWLAIADWFASFAHYA